MKRIVYPILILLVLAFAGIYILIPKKLKISSALTYHATGEGVFRFLTADSNWKKWWPGEISKSKNEKNIFNYSGFDLSIEKIRYHSFELNLTQNKDFYNSLLKVVSFKTDSIGIEIDTELNTGNDPVSKLSDYFKAKKIKKCFDGIIAALKNSTDSVEKLYGYNIRNEKVEMQYLLFANKEFLHYPTTEEIYSLITVLRNYISKTDGKEEFSPMLNIETRDSANYFVRIGIPVNKKIPDAKDIFLRQMVKNGNILVTEVKGDTKTITEAIKQVEKYISDYQRSIIAIPFQSLETERLKEPDSTKWITKIFYPVV